MSVSCSLEQILALAPDASAAKAGKDLANKARWKLLAQSEEAVWGECQGSGSTPYQVRADLSDVAFKCSCPSRKFPCKHSLALGILFALSPEIFTNHEPPAWVQEWLTARENRGRKKQKETAAEARSPEQLEEAKQARDKRKQERLSRIQAGVAELELFILDLMRQGIGVVKREPYSFWHSRSARLVDAQAPGLARLLNDCAEITGRARGWEEALIDKLATINLLCKAFHKIDELSDDLRADVLTTIGVNQSQEELLAGPAISDNWFVIAQYTYNEDKLRVQRNWLKGERSGRIALVLSFAHGTAPFDIMLMPGSFYSAELVFYQGTSTQRALIKSKTSTAAELALEADLTVAAALDRYSTALAATPWLSTLPLLLNPVTPLRKDEGDWWLIDQNMEGLPLSVRDQTGWQLLSYGGGQPIAVFGEWDGSTLKPLAAVNQNHYLRLHSQEV